MNENGFQFRTAAFGGFQKQDVMDYLERSAKEHAQKVAAIQKELAEEKVAKAGEEERSAALEERISALEAENQRLAADLADREDKLGRALTERDELRTLSDQLQDQLDKVTPAATAYEAVKDRTASIELEAHGRAQAIEQEGRAKALKYQEQVKEWFNKTREAYDRLRSDITATVDHAAQELERAGRSMEELSTGLEGQDSALAAIQAQLETLDSAKPPQPLPLEEER